MISLIMNEFLIVTLDMFLNELSTMLCNQLDWNMFEMEVEISWRMFQTKVS